MSEGDTDGSVPSGIRFDSQLSDYGIGFDLDVASRFTQISPILWPGFYNIFASYRRNFDGDVRNAFFSIQCLRQLLI